MAYQNHAEVLSALGRGHMEIWAEMAQRHGHIASFAIALGQYEWFARYESFGYALGNSDGSFQNDRTNNFYAWGTHIVHRGRWLNLARSDSRISYFIDPPEATRSFPSVIDFNGDGIPDLISGSSDGYFHVFEGIIMVGSPYPRWSVEYIGKLTGQNGQPLSVGAFSAPTIYAVTENRGKMVSGSYDGSIYIWDWYGGLQFGGEPLIIQPPVGKSLSAPDVVDWNGDGILDIIVGFECGAIYLYNGADGYTPQRLLDTGERNAAPRAIDINGDGSLELIVGTHNGDILRYINDNGTFVFDGSLKERENAGAVNFKNTDGINSGNNITPLFVDLNGDGYLDLVWGLLEYGDFSISIADEMFPYRAELMSTLEALDGMFVPVILHSYTHSFMSAEDEEALLLAEIAALDTYGIDTPTGVNQHTWWTSNESYGQTVYLQAEMGFLWNSGFRPGGSPVNPSSRAEYGMITPFYLYAENGNRMLLYNANYLGDRFWAPARYGLPITIYGHTWSDALYNHQALENYVLRTRDVQESIMYNFVTEPQLSKSIAAAMAVDVRVYMRPVDRIADFLRQATGRVPRMDRYLVIRYKDRGAPLFDERYAESVGIKVDLGDRGRRFPDTDSAVRFSSGEAFYMSLAGGGRRGTRIWTRHEDVNPEIYVMAINLPAHVVNKNGEITVNFLEDGLQQLFLYSKYPIDIYGDGFEVQAINEHIYRVGKTGARSTVVIRR
jgi:hypothetical protein